MTDLEEVHTVLPETRRALLLDTLRQHGALRVSELSSILRVTPVTIRRDVSQLAQEGLLRRVHGGVTLPPDRTGGSVTADRLDRDDVPLPAAPLVEGRVGMLVPSLEYYWPEVVRGAEEEGRAHDLRILLRGSSYESDEDEQQVRRLVEQPGLVGLLLAPNLNSPRSPELLDWLARSAVPSVLVERHACAPGLEQPMESVVSDHASGAAAAVRHLVGLGHRTIGLVVSTNSPTSRPVRQGWLETLAELGQDPALTVDGELDRHVSSESDPELVRIVDSCLSSGTTALIVHADTQAGAIVQHCHARGLTVPGDLSVVAYDDEVAELFSPALTAVRPPRRSIGKAAVELLAARLADPQRPVHRVIVTPRLNVRASTSPPAVADPR